MILNTTCWASDSTILCDAKVPTAAMDLFLDPGGCGALNYASIVCLQQYICEGLLHLP